MLLPGRHGYSLQSGWATGGSSNSLPATLTVDSRSGNTPAEYTATETIEFTGNFETGNTDAFTAYITEASPGATAAGAEGEKGIYRYGHNGVEKVNEIAGEGNHYTALFGEYDPRTVGRWNLDPKPNPSISPYAMYAGNPIWNSDPLLDTIIVNNKGGITRNDKTDNFVFTMQKGKLIQLGELGKTVDVNSIYKNLLSANAKEAKGIYNPFTFRNKVKGGGEWDLKANTNTLYGLANTMANKGEIPQTQFLFEGKSMEAQDVGNHHFGVVGKAYGLFSEETMLRKAGEAQISSGTSKPQWQPVIRVEKDMYIEHGMKVKTTEIIKLPPYGDDPRDQNWIKSGFEYYKKNK